MYGKLMNESLKVLIENKKALFKALILPILFVLVITLLFPNIIDKGKMVFEDNIIKIIEDKNCVISTLEQESDFPYRKIEFNNDNILLGNSNIMTVNDYVKMMVLSYQNKYPDTELSKKLGISRKSLWEKRKKLDIEKKK